MTTIRLTTSQALVRYLMNQWVEVDGERERFFAGMWGIFGHGPYDAGREDACR